MNATVKNILREYRRAVKTGEAFDDPFGATIRAQHPSYPSLTEVRESALDSIREHEAKGDLDSAIRNHSDAWRTAAVLHYASKLGAHHPAVREAFRDHYTHDQFPPRHGTKDRIWMKCLIAFMGAGTSGSTLTAPEDRAAFDALPHRFVIYRGTRAPSIPSRSWTTDPIEAAWFALVWPRGFDDKASGPVIVERTITKRSVFFYTDCRKEKEIVLRTECTGNPRPVTELERAAVEAIQARKSDSIGA